MAEPEEVVGEDEDWGGGRWVVLVGEDSGRERSRGEKKGRDGTAREYKNWVRELHDREMPQVARVDRMAPDTE